MVSTTISMITLICCRVVTTSTARTPQLSTLSIDGETYDVVAREGQEEREDQPLSQALLGRHWVARRSPISRTVAVNLHRV
jgi:hypothetical protein